MEISWLKHFYTLGAATTGALSGIATSLPFTDV